MDQAEIAGRPLYGLLTSADDLLTAVRARKEQLGLSNENLEELAGFCAGAVGKYLGPARVKSPTISSLELLFGALGVGVVLVEDAEAAKRMAHRWDRRNADRVRDNGRVAKSAIARTRPAVLADLGRKAAAARWRDKSPEQRREHSASCISVNR